jgi:hypothetical protein
MMIVMGLVVIAMGVFVLPTTSMGFVQIAAGAFLTYRGIQKELRNQSQSKGAK